MGMRSGSQLDGISSLIHLTLGTTFQSGHLGEFPWDMIEEGLNILV